MWLSGLLDSARSDAQRWTVSCLPQSPARRRGMIWTCRCLRSQPLSSRAKVSRRAPHVTSRISRDRAAGRCSAMLPRSTLRGYIRFSANGPRNLACSTDSGSGRPMSW